MYMQKIDSNTTKVVLNDSKVITMHEMEYHWDVSVRVTGEPPRFFAASFSKTKFPTLQKALVQVFMQLSDWLFSNLPQPEPKPQDSTFNGWKNYETWCVFTWTSNDEHNDYEAYKIVKQAAERDQYAEDILKEWFLTRWSRQRVPGLFQDLVQAALDNVDWKSIATHYSSK